MEFVFDPSEWLDGTTEEELAAAMREHAGHNVCTTTVLGDVVSAGCLTCNVTIFGSVTQPEGGFLKVLGGTETLQT